jgi:hydroxymethylpyrimidine/phosphomethylpyrimidine kinase
MRVAFSIAGSDPTGGAGLQADLQVFRALGVHGAGAFTAITVQDTRHVKRVLPVFPTVMLEQIRVAFADLTPDAVKLGMLASDDVARNVALALDASPGPPLVVDPVLAASDGTALLEHRALPVLRELIGRATIVTPNLAEAEVLVEIDVSTREGSEAAARALVADLGASAALVTGGHREGAPDDLLAVRDGAGVRLAWLPGQRVLGGNVHGTGCALAAAITAGLARGDALADAVARARDFVASALRASEQRGAGGRLLVYG